MIMHELSIAMSILDVAAEEAGRQGDARVTQIHLKLGPLSGVDRAALLSAYELARSGGPLEEAELVIQQVPVVVDCPVCETSRPAISEQDIRCAECGAPGEKIVGGRELEVVAIEIQ
jgi:hydrogenase nickel incorporation protein HypA/HybF